MPLSFWDGADRDDDSDGVLLLLFAGSRLSTFLGLVLLPSSNYFPYRRHNDTNMPHDHAE